MLLLVTRYMLLLAAKDIYRCLLLLLAIQNNII
jgi:hypothetical protein